MAVIEGVVAYQVWSLRGVPLYIYSYTRNVLECSNNLKYIIEVLSVN